MHSCIYEGTVSHHRREPITHAFRYRLYMVLLDIDELPHLVGRRRLIGNKKHAIRSFVRGDHLFDGQQTLRKEIREIAQRQTDMVHDGPIRILTQLRHFGFYFSPLNLFYLFDRTGKQVEAVVAEVNNTPWKERHCYVLWDGNQTDCFEKLRFAHPKQFHVSPFMSMQQTYNWTLSPPGDDLLVQLDNFSDNRKTFGAQMRLQRRELNAQQLRRMSFRYPLMTAQISASIYYQALKLWWKKCPFYPHPQKLSDTSMTTLPTGRS